MTAEEEDREIEETAGPSRRRRVWAAVRTMAELYEVIAAVRGDDEHVVLVRLIMIIGDVVIGAERGG
jgi:hypothetical protein